jgi:hypothetical protein
VSLFLQQTERKSDLFALLPSVTAMLYYKLSAQLFLLPPRVSQKKDRNNSKIVTIVTMLCLLTLRVRLYFSSYRTMFEINVSSTFKEIKKSDYWIYPSLPLSAWNNSSPTGWIFMKNYISVLIYTLSENSSFISIGQE